MGYHEMFKQLNDKLDMMGLRLSELEEKIDRQWDDWRQWRER